MTWYVGDVVRQLIPLFSHYDFGTVETTGVETINVSIYITDSNFLKPQNDDHWNGAFVLMLDGVSQYEHELVLDFEGATAKLIVASDNEDPEVGDEFLVYKSQFSLGQFLGAINQALHGIYVLKEDESLSVVDDQDEYTLPAGVSDVRVVELLDAEGEFAAEFQHWEEQDGVLRFDTYIPSTGQASTLRLKYVGAHDRIDELSDVVSIHPERLLWEAANHLMIQQSRNGHQDKQMEVFWMGLERNLRMARSKYPVRLPVKIKAQRN